MGGGHGSYGYQSRESGGTGAEYSGGGRATPRGTHQRGDQPQARDAEKLRELHFKNSRKTQLLAARSANGTISAGSEEENARNHHQHAKAACGPGAREAVGIRGR